MKVQLPVSSNFSSIFQFATIKTQLKALIARDLWDMNESFQVMNTTNTSVQQALRILNEKIYEQKLPL